MVSPNEETHGHVTVIEGSVTESEGSSIINASEFHSLKNLSEDIMILLHEASSFFADVVLKCESFSVPAHKCILSARSPVFSAMFKTDMRESRENSVDIDDINISVLRIMLVYIYTGDTDGLAMSNAYDLLFAADKYQLTRLKNTCSVFLANNANDENILNLFIFGHLHDHDLKNFAVKFISYEVETFSVLENSEEFKRLRKEEPDLVIELLISVIKAREEKL
ncbi:speckle-type POZ protein [Nephila pilipes]|uniref:Speckle-type POZ protein n=1 Tax=Nephila pilipes TaxID=299642 RepID=A0A8X6QUN5_NEPPI|nr:speckle-type POZ protein [Nephila pilipes]